MNVTKFIPITERVKFAVGASLFNLFNHPNFDLPLNNVRWRFWLDRQHRFARDQPLRGIPERAVDWPHRSAECARHLLIGCRSELFFDSGPGEPGPFPAG